MTNTSWTRYSDKLFAKDQLTLTPMGFGTFVLILYDGKQSQRREETLPGSTWTPNFSLRIRKKKQSQRLLHPVPSPDSPERLCLIHMAWQDDMQGIWGIWPLVLGYQPLIVLYWELPIEAKEQREPCARLGLVANDWASYPTIPRKGPSFLLIIQPS